jgi:Xaa-Pro aminopeptidase
MFFTEFNTPADEIAQRIVRFQQRLAEFDVDAALVLQRADLFYFSGTIQQAHLYIPADGQAMLMVRKELRRARAESPLDSVVELETPKQLVSLLKDHGYRLPRRLGLECDVLPANLYFTYRDLLSPLDIKDVSPIIRRVRAVKSPYEIGLIRRAADYSDELAASVPHHLREGISEIELAGRIESEARRRGHQGIVRMRLWGSEIFYGHLMAGPSAAVPSYMASPTGGEAAGPAVAQGPGFRPIQANEPVLVDYVFAHRGYLSDHARIFSIGPIPDRLQNAHQAMLNIQERVMAAARPGVSCADLYELARARAAELGYQDHFMGVGPRRVRFVGHGIGLELDEYPFLAQGQSMKLEEGMIIALEPKLIFPGEGVVGIENTHVVRPHGLEKLGSYDDGITAVSCDKTLDNQSRINY